MALGSLGSQSPGIFGPGFSSNFFGFGFWASTGPNHKASLALFLAQTSLGSYFFKSLQVLIMGHLWPVFAQTSLGFGFQASAGPNHQASLALFFAQTSLGLGIKAFVDPNLWTSLALFFV